MITSSHSVSRGLPWRNVSSRQKFGRAEATNRPWLLRSTPLRTFLIAAFVIAAFVIAAFHGGSTAAQTATGQWDQQAIEEARIDISAARPVARNNGSVGRSATPISFDVFSEAPIATVRPAGSGGRVFGRPSVSHAPASFELSCGCESVCDCPEPACGFEPACGIEPACGTEPACAMELWAEPGCGCEGVGCDACCDGYSPTCGCSSCSSGMSGLLNGCFPRMRIIRNRWELFAGFNGHTGPMNYANISATGTERRGNGSFGFYQGFNKGTPISFFENAMAWQSGVRFTQNNLSGTDSTTESREQLFVTSGLFRKVDYGFQFGLVLDYLYEDWYYRGDLLQIRGEAAWVARDLNVYGFKFAAALRDESALTSVLDDQQDVVRNDIRFRSVNQYRFFFRKPLPRCGDWEFFAGWTDDGDGLLGTELDIPIHGALMWNSSATYLVPSEGTGAGGNEEESWNIAFGFTFRPGGVNSGSRFNRPLLKVADNGSLMVDRR